MSKTSETIVFFGSGPVAAASLRLLAESFTIEAIITKPRPPHHRGDVPVLSAATELGLPVFTASNRRELDQLFETNSFSSRVGVLIDFGIIVSHKIIDAFELGIVNSHFSILPEWRGADPITFSILSGQAVTGVSLMLLVEAMDEGPLIAYGEYELPPTITTPQLTEHLIHLSDALLKAELPNYLAGKRKGAPQTITHRDVSYSRKLSKDDGTIDWSKPAEHIEREIRAFAGWPKSRTQLANKDVIITQAHVESGDAAMGTIVAHNAHLAVGTSKDLLIIDRIKPAGKQEMSGAEFLRGYVRSSPHA